jgi:Flp pilus assembly protein TadB
VKITEAMMFRAVVVVGLAMVPVVLLAAVVDPLAGAILFGVEALAALWLLAKRLRAARAQRPSRDLPPDAAEPEAAPVDPPVDSIR